MTHTWLLRCQCKSLDEIVLLTKNLKSLSRRVCLVDTQNRDTVPGGTGAVVKPQGLTPHGMQIRNDEEVLIFSDILEQLHGPWRYSFRICRGGKQTPSLWPQLDFPSCLVQYGPSEPQ